MARRSANGRRSSASPEDPLQAWLLRPVIYALIAYAVVAIAAGLLGIDKNLPQWAYGGPAVMALVGSYALKFRELRGARKKTRSRVGPRSTSEESSAPLTMWPEKHPSQFAVALAVVFAMLADVFIPHDWGESVRSRISFVPASGQAGGDFVDRLIVATFAAVAAVVLLLLLRVVASLIRIRDRGDQRARGRIGRGLALGEEVEIVNIPQQDSRADLATDKTGEAARLLAKTVERLFGNVGVPSYNNSLPRIFRDYLSLDSGNSPAWQRLLNAYEGNRTFNEFRARAKMMGETPSVADLQALWNLVKKMDGELGRLHEILNEFLGTTPVTSGKVDERLVQWRIAYEEWRGKLNDVHDQVDSKIPGLISPLDS